MKFTFILIFTFSLNTFANYNISSETVDGVTMTKNKEPAKNCVYLGSFKFQGKSMARDQKEIITRTKEKKGNFVIESYDNYPSLNHYGKVFKCP